MTSYPPLRVAVFVATGLIGNAAILADDPPAPTSQPLSARAVRNAADVNQLIDALGSPVWREREVAAERLMYSGPEAYDALRTAFDRTPSYEVRRRIREVVHEIYMTQTVGSGPAFLGIRLGSPAEVRVSPDISAVLVNGVVDLTAAERAGLRAGDIVCAVNDKPLTTEYYPNNLPGWISSQKPGTSAKLSVLRGGRGQAYRRPAQTADQAKFADLKLTEVDHGREPRIPPACHGLRVDQNAQIGDTIDLKTGDLIVGVNPAPAGPPQAARTRDELVRWATAEAPPVQPAAPNQPVIPVPMPVVPGRVPVGSGQAMYVLRGGEMFDVEVILGHVPDRAMATNLERADRLKTEAAFELWWQQTFDPRGLVAESKGVSDPSWRLTPRGKRR